MRDELPNQDHVERVGVYTCFMKVIDVEDTCRKSNSQHQAVDNLEWRNDVNCQGQNHIIRARQKIRRARKIE